MFETIWVPCKDCFDNKIRWQSETWPLTNRLIKADIWTVVFDARLVVEPKAVPVTLWIKMFFSSLYKELTSLEKIFMSIWLQNPLWNFQNGALWCILETRYTFIVMNTSELVVETRPEKKFRSLTGFEPMTSAILGAALYQLS